MNKNYLLSFSLIMMGALHATHADDLLSQIKNTYEEMENKWIPGIKKHCSSWMTRNLSTKTALDRCYRNTEEKGVGEIGPRFEHRKLVECAAQMENLLDQLEKEPDADQAQLTYYRKALNGVIKDYYLQTDVTMASWDIVNGTQFPDVDKNQVEKWISTGNPQDTPEALDKKFDQAKTTFEIALNDCDSWGRLNFTDAHVRECLSKPQRILVHFGGLFDNNMMYHTYSYSPKFLYDFVRYCDKVTLQIGNQCQNCLDSVKKKRDIINGYIQKYKLPDSN